MKVKINGSLQESVEEHFSDVSTSSQDKLAGDSMAEIIGDTYISTFMMSPVDQWTQIMKALRVHGFEINFEDNGG